MLLADGVTPVSLGQNVTLAQFTTLTFRPAMHGDSNGLRFGSAVVGAEGEAGSRHRIKSASAQSPANWLVLNLPQNSKPRLIGIPAPADFDYPISESCVRITELPSNGIVLLSDGTTVVGQGQTLTVAQLERFPPDENQFMGRGIDRDRGTSRDATPPTPPGIRVRTTAVRSS
ncbi:hypothetical protein V1284_000329 [Nitrobacteraceae bacterium AZCC 2299]